MCAAVRTATLSKRDPGKGPQITTFYQSEKSTKLKKFRYAGYAYVYLFLPSHHVHYLDNISNSISTSWMKICKIDFPQKK